MEYTDSTVALVYGFSVLFVVSIAIILIATLGKRSAMNKACEYLDKYMDRYGISLDHKLSDELIEELVGYIGSDKKEFLKFYNRRKRKQDKKSRT